jgi:hypothetical protein
MTTSSADARFEALLAECAERVRAGEELDVILAQYPSEYRDDLAALVPVTRQLSVLGREPSGDFVNTLESRLLAAVGDARTAQLPSLRMRIVGAWRRSAVLRFAAAAPVALLLLAGSGVAAAEASKDSLPGSALYPVRQARERAELLLARDSEARVETHSHHVAERGADLERAVNASDATVDAISAQAMRSVQAMVDAALRLHEQGNERAALRALLAIRAMEERLETLQAGAAPRHRPVFVRLRAAVREQEARLPVQRPRDTRPPNDRQQAVPPVERPVATVAPVPTRAPQATLTPLPTRAAPPPALDPAATPASVRDPRPVPAREATVGPIRDATASPTPSRD